MRAPTLGVTAGLLVRGQQQVLAVGLSVLSSEGKRELGLPERGLVIGEVAPGTPAARAGLRGGTRTESFRGGAIRLGGDVITAVDGAPVDALEDLQAGLIDRREGDTVTLTVVRAGESREVKVTLDETSFR